MAIIHNVLKRPGLKLEFLPRGQVAPRAWKSSSYFCVSKLVFVENIKLKFSTKHVSNFVFNSDSKFSDKIVRK